MTARIDRLSTGDLATLWAEDPATTPMQIGLAGLLDPAPLLDERGRLRLEELRAAVDARLVRAPELRRRIRWTHFGQGHPAVVDDGEFTIARHVTAVRLDHLDEQAFWTWCANRALAPLDRDHPLWQITFAIDLACGQVGVLIVMHHALADGVTGAALTARLLDTTPDSIVAHQPWQPTPPPSPLELAADAAATRLAAIGQALRRLPRAPSTSAPPAATRLPPAPRSPAMPRPLP